MPHHILFLCTANSARSVLAEVLLNELADGRFIAHSAGSKPRGSIHEVAIETLRRHGHGTDGLHSKSWQAFAGADAPPVEFVITVCDNAAGETCPIWPGHPMTAHWGIEDPAAATGGEAALGDAFELAYQRMKARIERFLALPFEHLEGEALRDAVRAIGNGDAA